MASVPWPLPPSIVGPLVIQSSLFFLAGTLAALAIQRRIALRFTVIVMCFAAAIVAPISMFACRALGWILLPRASRVIDLSAPDAMTDLTGWGQAIQVGSAAFGWIFVLAVLVMVTRFVVSCVRGLGIRNRAEDVNDARLLEDIERLSRRIGIRRTISVRSSDEIQCPVIWCWRKSATLILPTHGEGVTQSVLCHELCHLQRRDHIWAMLVELGWCLFAWHPLAWALRRQFRETLEQACDLHALSVVGSRYVYAEALLGISPELTASPMLAAARSRSSLSRRIAVVLSERYIGVPLARSTFLTLLTLTTIVVCGVAVGQRPESVFYRFVGASKNSEPFGGARHGGLSGGSSSDWPSELAGIGELPAGDAVWVGKRGHEFAIPADSNFLPGERGSLRFLPASELGRESVSAHQNRSAQR